jgi:hypothetical protein
MPRTATIGKTVYSVDMMFAYVNLFRPRRVSRELASIAFDPSEPSWGDGARGELHSVNDVIERPAEFPDDARRIREADLSFPIIIDRRGAVFDGWHRCARAHQERRKHIDAYELDADVIAKFIIDRAGNNNKESHQLIELFHRRFAADAPRGKQPRPRPRPRPRSRSRSRSRSRPRR